MPHCPKIKAAQSWLHKELRGIWKSPGIKLSSVSAFSSLPGELTWYFLKRLGQHSRSELLLILGGGCFPRGVGQKENTNLEPKGSCRWVWQESLESTHCARVPTHSTPLHLCVSLQLKIVLTCTNYPSWPTQPSCGVKHMVKGSFSRWDLRLGGAQGLTLCGAMSPWQPQAKTVSLVNLPGYTEALVQTERLWHVFFLHFIKV